MRIARLRGGLASGLALAMALALALLMGLAPPIVARAQSGGPDFNLRALDWARGRYASPLLCEMDGTAVRGVRRLLIAPGPRHVRPPVGRLVFVKLEVDPGARCFAEIGGDVPNIAGTLQIRHPSTAGSDLAARQFDIALRRERGFEYHIPEGHLVVQPLGANPGPARRVDFRGGRVRLHIAGPGSDAERLLSDLPPGRRAVLELESREGETLRLPVAMTDAR